MPFIDPDIERYSLAQSTQPGAICAELAEATREREPRSQMLAGAMVASLLGFLVRATGAKRILEIGTFTGYSALAMAEHLPEEGEVHTVDIAPRDWAAPFWQKSSHGYKITPHAGPALEVVPRLPGPFDMAFIDADKANYEPYLNLSLERLAPGGIVVADNALWSGEVLKAEDEIDENARAIKTFNRWVASRHDLHSTLLPVRDGLLLVCRSGRK